jgi:hypothetical protein
MLPETTAFRFATLLFIKIQLSFACYNRNRETFLQIQDFSQRFLAIFPKKSGIKRPQKLLLARPKNFLEEKNFFS